ncbi:MAG: beta-ketoacyl synthase N-terminal-like domain-containing protein, partial [Gammaproteobacteria bacterium]
MTNNSNNKPAPGTVPLAIVGIGCLFPGADNPESYWTNIRDGVDAITDIPKSHWDPDDYFNQDKNAPDMTYARRGGFIDPVDFDPLLYGLSPNNIEATDTTQLLGMVVARQALLDAGYSTSKDNKDGRSFDRNRTSVILGVTGTLELVIPLGARLGHPIWRKALAEAGIEGDLAEDVVQRIAEGYVPWQENSFPGLLGNVAAGRIANRFDLGGTNCVVDAACASSLSALHMAAMELYAGRSDMAITGGFDTFNDIFMYMCFSKTPALSPTGNSRPFDINGDGTILGEGLGAVILKRLDDARRDNDKIYAVIRGIGSSSDGRGNAIYAPSANGQTKALRNAYQEAGVSPSTIELVEAHGTGTRVGDAVEAEALSSVYRTDQAEGSWCAIGSVKSMIGHTKAAAGVAGLIKIAMALKHKTLPPTIKVDRPLEILNPGIAPVYVNTHKRPWVAGSQHPRRAALSAFGFGGSNFHCVLEEAETTKPEIEWDGKVLMLALGADSLPALQSKLKHIDADADWKSLRRTAAESLQQFSHTNKHRLVLIITPTSSLEKLLDNAAKMLQQEKAITWSSPEGIYYGTGKAAGKLGMLFPGQGAQYPDMLLDLACQFPQMQTVLAEADGIFGPIASGQRLSNLIYPIPVFSDEARARNVENLRATQHAQPAIGTTSLGALHILKSFGIRPDITAGHSFGELTALCAAGRINDNDLHRLAIKRGELMQMGTGDHGAMLAVSASAAVIHEILEAEQLDLIIANNNAPRQVVLSGATDQIERALGLIEKRGLVAKRLPVSAAFHSSFVTDAEKPFTAFLESVPFNTGKIPVFANTTSEPYPEDNVSAKALLAHQLAQPVEFVTQVENMYEAGVRTFVEVGPGNILTGLVKSILTEKPVAAFALDSSKGKRGGQYDLACTLAQLACHGHDIKLGLWDGTYLERSDSPDAKPAAMTVSLSGANYVKPRPKREPVTTTTKQSSNATVTMTSKPEKSAATTTGQQPRIQTDTQAQTDNPLLLATQQSILALQKMQEHTADLHRRYLEGQESAQQSIRQLIEQQHQLMAGIPVAPGKPAQPGPATASDHQDVSNQADETPATADIRPAVPASANKPEVPVRKSEKSHGNIEALLLEVISDKTGYPVDMLSMGMSLDTDLGIDSIKRVEILSALQEKLPGTGKIQPEDLGSFSLLKHIVE